MVFSLMQDVATQEMHLEIATIRKIMFKRSENRSEETFIHFEISTIAQTLSRTTITLFHLRAKVKILPSFKLYPNRHPYFRMAQVLVLNATQAT